METTKEKIVFGAKCVGILALCAVAVKLFIELTWLLYALGFNM